VEAGNKVKVKGVKGLNYYLGVDAGATKTVAIITDEYGHLIGSGKSGPGNHQINVEEARESLREAIFQALEFARLFPHDISVALFGLAGADRDADYRVLRPLVDQLGFPGSPIVCDTIIAMRAGTTRSYGAVLICGTGMNAAGIGKNGEMVQVGGFGYAYGDFGGGGDLSVEVFRTVIRSWEGRSGYTSLTGKVLETFGYPSVERMFHSFLDQYKRIPSTLTKILFDAAEEGDHAAIQILQKQGLELGLSAKAVIQRLNLQEDSFDLVLAGSVLTKGNSAFIHPYIAKEVHAVAPHCRLKALTVEPVVGSILLGMEKDGITITSSIYEQLDQISNIEGAKCIEQ
jgi:N-acetylglucosamine kinase-like BadF-type ATPase